MAVRMRAPSPDPHASDIEMTGGLVGSGLVVERNQELSSDVLVSLGIEGREIIPVRFESVGIFLVDFLAFPFFLHILIY